MQNEFGAIDLLIIIGALIGVGLCIVLGAALIHYGPRLARGFTHGLAALFDTGNERRPLVRFVRAAGEDMSSSAPDNSFVPNSAERRSYAVEPTTEQSGTVPVFPPSAVIATLEQLDDDALLDILAQVKKDGGERFTDSRIAKFIGGRIEDRVAQVREARAKSAPPAKHADARQLTIRSRAEGEHVVSF